MKQRISEMEKNQKILEEKIESNKNLDKELETYKKQLIGNEQQLKELNELQKKLQEKIEINNKLQKENNINKEEIKK